MWVRSARFGTGSPLRHIVAGALLLVASVCGAAPVAAHPAPFSYIDVYVRPAVTDVTLVIHVYDLAHELPGVEPEAWLEPDVLAARAADAIRLLESRFRLQASGRELDGAWLEPLPSSDTDAVRFRVRYPPVSSAERLRIDADLFPYDPMHQTFVNVYGEDQLRTQAVLNGSRSVFIDDGAAPASVWTAVRRFLPSGIRHILIGPDHLLFLVGLLLRGGALRQLVWVVTAFTLAHSITLSLAALSVVMPPPGLVEPVIALSVVYVGIDNLLVGRGRDVRAWIAFVFGLIHGFGFASVLQEIGLPDAALVSALVSFNAGVEIGQVAVVVVVAGALTAVRARSAKAGRLVVVAGSTVVIAAGAWWFVERVFLRGGL